MDDRELGERLRRATDAMQCAGRALRDAVYDLRQEDGERSFVRAVESLVELNRRMSQDCEVELEVGEGFPEEMPETVSAELLSVVQEALNNARRHSRARNVRVALRADGGDLVAEVSDDGRGFGAETSPGTGLKTMRERADSLGGELRVESEPGRGTWVLVRVPIRDAG